MVPVTAPVGTVAMICVSEVTGISVAATPPSVTRVVFARLTPVIVTGVPSEPLDGERLAIYGVTR
jgi:hypothetical protein